VNCFFEDSKGNLWLGTSAGGLSRFDYASGKFIRFTSKHGLPDNSVYSILEDHKGRLWLGTGHGLSGFDPLTESFVNYDYKDGLQDNVFAAGHRGRPARFKANDGTLYFGGQKGLNFFNPEELGTNTVLAPVVITQFKLFDKLVKGAAESKQIVLNHNENYFSFEFSSLSYHNPAKNQYAYKLEGFDKDWVYSGTRRYAGYTNINPGRYTFRVKATNSDAVWNEQGISIPVIINPPWWRTWWAYSIYGLILVAAGWIVHNFQRQRVIRVEREKAQRKEIEHAREIEKAYHELKTTQQQLIQSEKMASLGELTAGIAHEIQNPLNFINNFSELNRELIGDLETEKAKPVGERNEQLESEIFRDISQNLEKISHHGKRADGIVKGMLLHSRKSTGQKEAANINELADEYLRLAFHGMRARDKEFNVTTRTNLDNSLGPVHIVPQDIGRVILNLITNAFHAVMEKLHQQDHDYEPVVTLSTHKRQDKVELSVEDNGNGIPRHLVDKIFQPFFTTKPAGQGTGLGLSLAYEIITKGHGGELKVKSEEGKGTIFIIQIPIAP
jgi:signal transduction histidine kinase